MKLLSRLPHCCKYLVDNRYWAYVYKGNSNMDFVYDTKSGKRLSDIKSCKILLKVYNEERKQNNE